MTLVDRITAALEAHASWVTLALFVVALLPRLWVATQWATEPVWDGHYYHFGAQRIAMGLGYSEDVVTARGTTWHPWCHYPVGYSGFLAGFYALFGAKPAVATIVGAFTGAATVAVIHRLALHFLGPKRALAAGVLCAAQPTLIVYSALLMTEPLAALGILLAPLVYLALARRPLAAAAAAGVVLGLTTLVRPQSLLLAPAIALLVTQGGSDAPWWRSLLRRATGGFLATLVALAVVAPWTLRNCKVMDECAFVSTNAGWNLAIGSSPHATGRFEPMRPSDGCRSVTGQVNQDRCWWAQGVSWIRDDPARWIQRADEKLSFTFDHQSFAIGYLEQGNPRAWPEERRSLGRTILSAAQYGLMLLAALGATLLPVRRPNDVPSPLALVPWLGILLSAFIFALGSGAAPRVLWPTALAAVIVGMLPPFRRASKGVVPYLVALLASVIVVHVVFFGEDRYQVFVTPALCLLAACALRTDAPSTAVR